MCHTFWVLMILQMSQKLDILPTVYVSTSEKKLKFDFFYGYIKSKQKVLKSQLFTFFIQQEFDLRKFHPLEF